MWTYQIERIEISSTYVLMHIECVPQALTIPIPGDRHDRSDVHRSMSLCCAESLRLTVPQCTLRRFPIELELIEFPPS
jgi:hypothetical protein